ncbi:hypothetical protein EV132_1031 [Rhizobium sullae]|uniref:Uncharacterized protein n=1 Tax=Rhizobium sullae TaxID=50338 RepID=A0A4V2V9Q8_RHISU|nr:hypothetical protein EV132_1031 [Rhizobium sullae]
MKTVTPLSLAILLSLAGASGFVTPALADYKVRICTGEDQANGCPVSHDAMFGCGVSYDQAAEVVCTVTENAQKQVLPYTVLPQGTHSGGRCGYGWALVTCRQ